jgi:hypothetical protein
MSRDVAERDLDQAGFRIVNLGEPQAPGDATHTDNRTPPNQTSGSGAPGNSLLASPADHVHPMPIVFLPIDFEGEHEVAGQTESVVAQRFIDMTALTRRTTALTVFTALVDVDAGTGTFRVRAGGGPDTPDGAIMAEMTIQSAAPNFTPSLVNGPPTPVPAQALLKISAFTDDPGTTCRIKGARIVLIG